MMLVFLKVYLEQFLEALDYYCSRINSRTSNCLIMITITEEINAP